MEKPDTLEAMQAFVRAVWNRATKLEQAKKDLDAASMHGGVLATSEAAYQDGTTVIVVDPHVIVPFIQMEIIRLQQQCDADDEKLRQIFNIIT